MKRDAPPQQLRLSVLLLKGATHWVAQCLEYDLAAQGKEIDDALRSFTRTLNGQILLDIQEKVAPLSRVLQAPKEYWSIFEHAKRLAE